MSARKLRMTVTVDRELVEAASDAVASGRASSVSTWVNAALSERAAKDRHLEAMAEAVADYEAQFGAITAAELAAQQRDDRHLAITIRSPRRAPARRRRDKAA